MPSIIGPVSALSLAMVGTGWNMLAYCGGIAWLSPTSRPHMFAVCAARAISTRFCAWRPTSSSPIGRSVNAPGGSAAVIAWYIARVCGPAGNRNRNEVPTFMARSSRG